MSDINGLSRTMLSPLQPFPDMLQLGWFPCRRPQVPPMTPEKTQRIIESQLGVKDLSEVFEWIDLSKPLGSASIAQVRGRWGQQDRGRWR